MRYTKTLGRRVLAGAAAGAALLVTLPGVASADDAPASLWPGYGNCNPTAPATNCLSFVVKSGTVQLGALAPMEIPEGGISIQAGAQLKGLLGSGGATIFTKDDGANGVYSKPMRVPGGIIGKDLPLGDLFGLNTVTATVEATEAPEIVGNALRLNMRMNSRIKVSNPLVGGNCYIGTAETPVTLELQGPGSVPLKPKPADTPEKTLYMQDVKNTATGFTVPGATGCGPFGVLSGIVNSRVGLPSDGTGNSITTVGDVFIAPLPATPAGA